LAQPFETRHAEEDGVLSRVPGRRSRAAAVRDLESLLAGATRVRDVTLECVKQVGARHGVDLGGQLRTARRNLYRRLFEHCLADYMLSDREVEDLTHLRAILRLEDADIARIQDRVAQDVYGNAVAMVLDDDEVDDEEKAFLKRLREDLDVSEFHASRMYEEELRRAQQRMLAQTPLDPAFLSPGAEVVELEGGSRTGVVEAIRAVVGESHHAMPDLSWAELTEVRVRIADGEVVQWRVKLRAGVQAAGPDA